MGGRKIVRDGEHCKNNKATKYGEVQD
jgi:hypothetical protein